MGLNPAARFAVIDEKLDSIDKKLDRVQRWMEAHELEHKEISKKLSRQDVINGILTFVSGAVVAAVITLLFNGL